MTRLMITSDLHLGHKNICKYREGFESEEHHNETLYENLASNIKKRDTIYFLGDIAFDRYWLKKISEIKCAHKVLVTGNHDIEHGIKMRDLVESYDDVKPFFSHRNYWFSHCPIHPCETRFRLGNIHGHTHQNNVTKVVDGEEVLDYSYFNASVDVTDLKPISFNDLINRKNIRGTYVR